LDEKLQKVLYRFYDSFRYQMEIGGKLKSDSVLTTSIKQFKNTRFRPLKESAIDGHKIPPDLLSQLTGQNLVRSSGELAKFVITGKGIWEAEKARGLIDETRLIDFIDSNFFEVLFEQATPLTDREKVVLFTMLAARAFSEGSSADMKRSREVNSAWLDAFMACSSELRKLGVITTENVDIFPDNSQYEDVASHFIRHTDRLPRKTRAIFKSSSKRDNRYFLDVRKNDEVELDRLAYLFWLVLGSQLTVDNIDSVNDFCASVAYDRSVQLFEHEKHVFASPRYDDVVRSAIIESIVSRQKW